jgi:tripartite-type tricarboxylate transporter receptor subunit TctC
MMSMRSRCAAVLLAAVCCPITHAASSAQLVEGFYRDKVLSLIVGFPPAGANDVYVRAVARHIGKYIPGRPTVVVRHMPGAGSLIAANHLFNVAPKDGTVLGLVAPGIPLEGVLGGTNVKFKPSLFNWIGRIAPTPGVLFVMNTVPVKTIKDAMEREVVLAATGRSSPIAISPTVLNNVVGTKFKLILGYQGTAASMLAMERGEVEGHSTSWDAVKSTRGDWVRDGTIRILVQHALKRQSDLPNVPTSVELARTPTETQILRTVFNGAEVGRVILSSPGAPSGRVEALRRAFDRMVKDNDFGAELKAAQVELDPIPGEQLQSLVDEISNVSPEILARVKSIYPFN